MLYKSASVVVITKLVSSIGTCHLLAQGWQQIVSYISGTYVTSMQCQPIAAQSFQVGLLMLCTSGRSDHELCQRCGTYPGWSVLVARQKAA